MDSKIHNYKYLTHVPEVGFQNKKWNGNVREMYIPQHFNQMIKPIATMKNATVTGL